MAAGPSQRPGGEGLLALLGGLLLRRLLGGLLLSCHVYGSCLWGVLYPSVARSGTPMRSERLITSLLEASRLQLALDCVDCLNDSIQPTFAMFRQGELGNLRRIFRSCWRRKNNCDVLALARQSRVRIEF
jgi:hypothetical protein